MLKIKFSFIKLILEFSEEYFDDMEGKKFLGDDENNFFEGENFSVDNENFRDIGELLNLEL